VNDYEVVCGNVGSVYAGHNKAQAIKAFNTYVESSKAECGRAGGEDVTLFQNGEIAREYIGSNSAAE
jgi:hypothetical protein